MYNYASSISSHLDGAVSTTATSRAWPELRRLRRTLANARTSLHSANLHKGLNSFSVEYFEYRRTPVDFSLTDPISCQWATHRTDRCVEPSRRPLLGWVRKMSGPERLRKIVTFFGMVATFQFYQHHQGANTFEPWVRFQNCVGLRKAR